MPVNAKSCISTLRAAWAGSKLIRIGGRTDRRLPGSTGGRGTIIIRSSLIACAGIVLAQPAQPQPSRELRERIETDFAFSLAASGSFTPGDDVTLTTESRLYSEGGTIYVGPLQQSYQWLELDRGRGSYEVFGRRGEGPGEFMSVDFVSSMGDTQARLVFHESRVSRIGASGDYEGGRLFPAFVLNAAGLRQALLVSAVGPERDGTPLRLYAIGERGELVRDAPVHHHRKPARWQPARVAFTESGAFVLDSYQYDILMHDTAGAAVDHFTRAARWYQPPDRAGMPRTTFIVAHHQDSLLFIIAAVRDTEDRPSFSSLTDYESQHDFVMEVIDPASAAVIATRRFSSAPFHGSLGKDGVYRMEEDPLTGSISLRFFTIIVNRPGGLR